MYVGRGICLSAAFRSGPGTKQVRQLFKRSELKLLTPGPAGAGMDSDLNLSIQLGNFRKRRAIRAMWRCLYRIENRCLDPLTIGFCGALIQPPVALKEPAVV